MGANGDLGMDGEGRPPVDHLRDRGQEIRHALALPQHHTDGGKRLRDGLIDKHLAWLRFIVEAVAGRFCRRL